MKRHCRRQRLRGSHATCHRPETVSRLIASYATFFVIMMIITVMTVSRRVSPLLTCVPQLRSNTSAAPMWLLPQPSSAVTGTHSTARCGPQRPTKLNCVKHFKCEVHTALQQLQHYTRPHDYRAASSSGCAPYTSTNALPYGCFLHTSDASYRSTPANLHTTASSTQCRRLLPLPAANTWRCTLLAVQLLCQAFRPHATVRALNKTASLASLSRCLRMGTSHIYQWLLPPYF
jgi:hypothetical protein